MYRYAFPSLLSAWESAVLCASTKTRRGDAVEFSRCSMFSSAANVDDLESVLKKMKIHEYMRQLYAHFTHKDRFQMSGEKFICFTFANSVHTVDNFLYLKTKMQR